MSEPTESAPGSNPTVPPAPHGEGREAADPIEAFREAWSRARERHPGDPTAMNLATADRDGAPSSRVVLLKGLDERGFVFYTNYRSRKARQLDANPRAALCAYWEATGQQIRVEGTVEKVTAEESDEYFESRPRLSQIGAWASSQSDPLESRAVLLARATEVETEYGDGEIPRPPHWGGYRLIPDRIEFWWNQDHRLHDRVLYRREGDGWRTERLYP